MRAVIFYLLLITLPFSVHATHIRAGEILVENINEGSLIYRITVIMYIDTQSDVPPGTGTLEFGDGHSIPDISSRSDSTPFELLDHHLARFTYSFIHTYPGDSADYTVSYTELNRNAGIINMENSVATPFYIETTFVTESPCEKNTTPIFLLAPIDYASPGQTVHPQSRPL